MTVDAAGAATPAAPIPAAPLRPRAGLRKAWFNVHLWLGVGLTVLFIPIGLSGAVMVWPELTSPPVVVSGGPATLAPSRYLEAAAAALGPGGAPTQLRLPTEAGRPVTVSARPAPRNHGGGEGHKGQGGGRHGRAGEAGGAAPFAAAEATPAAMAPALARPAARPRPIIVTLAPADARVISVGAGGRGPVWVWMHNLHERLFIQGWGRQAVGWLGFAMLASAVTGLILWWPRAGDLIAALRWRRTSGQLLNLHYTTGFWICLPLALLALTGAALGFPQTSRSLIGQFAPVTQQGPRGLGGPAGGGQGPLATPHLTPDDAAAAARALRPGAALSSLALPTRGQPVWKAEFAKAAPVQVDDASGVAVAAPAQPAGDVFWRWIHRVHGGDAMPMLWKLILTLAGLAPTILGVTGVCIWIGKSRRKRARAA